MEKRKYVPMKLEVEEFQMNEAVAACALVLTHATAKCDDCIGTTTHYWELYDVNGAISTTEGQYSSGTIGVFRGKANEWTESCRYFNDGDALYHAADGALEAHFEPFPEGTAGKEEAYANENKFLFSEVNPVASVADNAAISAS